MLCLKTINTDGKLGRQIGEILIPYDIEKIQRDCKWFSADTIRVALNLYKAFGLIYEDTDGTLVLAEHKNLVGSETDYSVQKRLQREGTKSLPSVDNVYSDVHQNVHTDIRNKEIRDKEIRDIEIKSTEVEGIDDASPQAEAEHCPFVKIKDLYHQICISYPKLRSIDGNRKKAIAARWRMYKSLDIFDEVFRNAENSEFLKGNNDRNWSADFDWMMKPTNFAKILEGKYNKNDNSYSKASGALGVLQELYEEAQNDTG